MPRPVRSAGRPRREPPARRRAHPSRARAVVASASTVSARNPTSSASSLAMACLISSVARRDPGLGAPGPDSRSRTPGRRVGAIRGDDGTASSDTVAGAHGCPARHHGASSETRLAQGRPVVVNTKPHCLVAIAASASGRVALAPVSDRFVMPCLSASRAPFFIQGNTISGQGRPRSESRANIESVRNRGRETTPAREDAACPDRRRSLLRTAGIASWATPGRALGPTGPGSADPPNLPGPPATPGTTGSPGGPESCLGGPPRRPEGATGALSGAPCPHRS